MKHTGSTYLIIEREGLLARIAALEAEVRLCGSCTKVYDASLSACPACQYAACMSELQDADRRTIKAESDLATSPTCEEVAELRELIENVFSGFSVSTMCPCVNGDPPCSICKLQAALAAKGDG